MGHKGDATDEQYAYLYQKANIILCNNLLFSPKTNACIAKLIDEHCGKDTVIISSEVRYYKF